MSLGQGFSFGFFRGLCFHCGDISLSKHINTRHGTAVTPVEVFYGKFRECVNMEMVLPGTRRRAGGNEELQPGIVLCSNIK